MNRQNSPTSDVSSDSDKEIRSTSPLRPLTPKQLGQKRPLVDIQFLDSLKCQVCLCYYKPPVVQCTNGHCFCKDCVNTKDSFGQQVCSICNKHINMRNFMVEEQLERLKVNCKWNQFGCNKQITIVNLQKHEFECEFNQGKKCVFSETNSGKQCSYFGSSNEEMTFHLLTHTPEQSIDIFESKAHFKVNIELPKNIQEEQTQIQLLKVRKMKEDQDQALSPSNPFYAFRPKNCVLNEYLFIFKSFYDPKKQAFIFMLNTHSNYTAEYFMKINRFEWEMSFKLIAENMTNFKEIKNYLNEEKKNSYVVIAHQQMANISFQNAAKSSQQNEIIKDVNFNLEINLPE